MRLQATNVVEQWGAEETAERKHQKQHQAHSAFQEVDANSTAAATPVVDYSAQSLPFDADVHGILPGVNATNTASFRCVSILRI